MTRTLTRELNSRSAFMFAGYVCYVILLVFMLKVAYDFSTAIVDRIYQPYFEAS